MEHVHNWKPKDARAVIAQFGLRKPRKVKSKNRRKLKNCPIVNCQAVVRRLPQHLVTVHKIDRKSLKYKQILMSKELDFSDDQSEGTKSGEIPKKDSDVLERFEMWSRSPLGGGRNIKTALQYKLNVKKTLLRVEGSYSMYNLFNLSTLNKTLDKISEGKRARTVKSYIHALERFCSFYVDELEMTEQPFHCDESSRFEKPSKDDISGLVSRLKNLSASFNTEVQKNKWNKKEKHDFKG